MLLLICILSVITIGVLLVWAWLTSDGAAQVLRVWTGAIGIYALYIIIIIKVVNITCASSLLFLRYLDSFRLCFLLEMKLVILDISLARCSTPTLFVIAGGSSGVGAVVFVGPGTLETIFSFLATVALGFARSSSIYWDVVIARLGLFFDG